MVPDAECLKVVHEIIESLDIGPFMIKVNHRLLLDGILEACGVPQERFRNISAAIDKFSKVSCIVLSPTSIPQSSQLYIVLFSPKNYWHEVRKEMIEERGLQQGITDCIGDYIGFRGRQGLIDRFLADPKLSKVKRAVEGLKALKLMLEYCELYEVEETICLDPSLARGLDYYTGIIYEVLLLGKS